jgi:Pyridoxamine 5'-phosphate oxidase
MGKLYPNITPAIADWIKRQPLFFVATAPLHATHHVNISPKGLDTFRILDERHVAYLDYTGSGAETIAQMRENGRITFMFCAFSGPPKIVRLHGQGRVVMPASHEGLALAPSFVSTEPPRSYIVADIARISDSCGFGVPMMRFESERDAMQKWAVGKSAQDLADYRRAKNAASIDGLPAWDDPETMG